MPGKLSKSKQKSLRIMENIEKASRKAAGKDFVPKKIRMNEMMDEIAKVMGDPNYKVKAKGGAVTPMEMGGEVMDTTKAMPVGMMDGGKVKPMKMNMGGVVPGRGGKFKGVR
jgi:hypothetical protein